MSSEKNYDFLRFTVNGIVIKQWSGEKDWAIFNYSFTPGTYNIKWEYKKDGASTGGSDTAWIDAVELYAGGALFRLVDGSEGDGKVLVSDASGNASWQNISDSQVSDFSDIVNVSRMEIPRCYITPVGTTGSFTTEIRGVTTTISWEVLARQTKAGQTVNLGGVNVLRAPFNPSRLQVRYDFSPNLPFSPDGIVFSGNNDSSFPDTFSINYAKKSASSITMNITRTDRFGDLSSSDPCWTGEFFFDILMSKD